MENLNASDFDEFETQQVDINQGTLNTINPSDFDEFETDPIEAEEDDILIDASSFVQTDVPVEPKLDDLEQTQPQSQAIADDLQEYFSMVDNQYIEYLGSDVMAEITRRQEDANREQQNYIAMVEAAKKEDAITGGQRALMIPKPQSQEFVDVSTKLYREKLESTKETFKQALQDPNPLRSGLAKHLLDSGMNYRDAGWILSGAEFAPVTGTALWLGDVPEDVRIARQAYEDGDWGTLASTVGWMGAEGILTAIGTGAAVKQTAKKVKSKLRTTQVMEEIRTADAEAIATKAAAAKEVADEAKEIRQQLIDEFENDTGYTISNTDSNGVKTLNGQKAREAGLEIARDVSQLQDERAIAFARNPEEARQKFSSTYQGTLSDEVAYNNLTDNVEELVNPLLIPEKFNAIVAVANDFQKANPKAFRNNKSIIDNLFDYTVSNDLEGSQELADTLAKYGLTFDDYVLTVVGSGSEAGKILNKLSQIRRAGNLDIHKQKKNKALEMGQPEWLKVFRRVENVRRGGMVSMIKTAGRNLQSAVIRTPLEALENVFDTVLYNMSDTFHKTKDAGFIKASFNAAAKGTTTFVSPRQWKGSTRALQRTFANPYLAREVTEFVLDRPEFAKQYDNLFNLVNEYQKNTGRGQATTRIGKAVDSTLGVMEDTVTFLNTPNRIQEFIIRRGAFMGELERLTLREYDLNLIDALKQGKLPDLMSNSSTVRPKGARTFEDLIEDSTRHALDVTYAKAPDTKMFNDFSNWLSRNGLTAVTTPFPRFMFNALELTAQYSAGAFNPALKRVLGYKKGPLDARDRKQISRNIVGLSGITAALMYRNSEDAPANYANMNTEEGVMDTRAIYPLRQFLWIAEGIKRLGKDSQKYVPTAAIPAQMAEVLSGKETPAEGTFNNWFDIDEATEVFLGSQLRGAGTVNIFVEELQTILAGAEDISGAERRNRVIGRAVSDYLRTWGIPLTQIVEVQRATGDRPADYRDAADDEITLGATMGEQIGMDIRRMGRASGLSNLLTPSEEEKRPIRPSIFSDGKERKGIMLSATTGITQFSKNSPEAEYLEKLGYDEYELSSKERIPSVRRAENQFLLEMLPTQVEVLKDLEQMFREDYNSTETKQSYRDKTSIEKHVATDLAPFVESLMRKAKQMVGDAKFAETNPILVAHRKFKRMPKSIRKVAISEFNRVEDEELDLTNPEHMAILQGYADIYKKATN